MDSTHVHNARSQVLLSLVAQGLVETARLQTASMLGDRSQYVGMSDIGRAMDCQRAAVGQKLFGGCEHNVSLREPELSKMLGRQLRLQRGHWFEAGVARVFRNLRMPVIEQLEIQYNHGHVPIRAHLDFTFVVSNGQPTVRILELKSCEQIPSTLYSSYETQVYGQVGLIKSLWNQPVFGLREANGRVSCQGLSFAELCRDQLGITMPTRAEDVDIEAWVLCLGMSDAKVYGPYRANDDLLRFCLTTAQNLWDTFSDMRDNGGDFSDLPIAQGFHALCSWCDFNANCPKFQGLDQPQWEDTLTHLAVLKADRDNLEAQIAHVEDGLKTGYRLSKAASAWIEAGRHRFRLSPQAGRRTLNKETLRLELSIALGEDAADSLIARCESEGRPFERLIIQQINGAKEL